MAKKKSTTSLKVLLNNLYLGNLGYKSRKLLTFQYSPEWLQRELPFPISRTLPLREDPFDGDEVYSYFDNLLPDGDPIRQRIAARMNAPSEQVYDLLSVLGRDCVGALQFVRADEDETASSTEPSGTPISEDQIAEKLKNLNTIPLGASEEEDFRISIAGAQEKTAFLKLKGKWYLPKGATPTTHIFKPQVGNITPRLNFSDSVENEWLCAQIAKEFGLPVTNCEIGEFDKTKVLIVERFDRTWVKDRLIRIPQEDMCQALGVPSFEKYQSDGGPGVNQIMDLLNESQKRETDRALFMKAQVVFLLLAAIDGHAKNFSIRWGPRGFWMTPLYDILSAHPLVQRGNLPKEKIKMAMAIGNKPHWKLREIAHRHFIQQAKISRFDGAEMDAIIEEIVAQMPTVIARISSKLPKTFPNEVSEAIFKGMREQVGLLENS